MKTRTKMMLMTNRRGGGRDARNEYGPESNRGEDMRMGYMPRYDGWREPIHMTYPMEAERSGSRGYDREGRSYPIYPSSNYEEGMEGRFRNYGRRGRDKAGRFTSADSYQPAYPFVPPIYDRGERRGRDGGMEMNRIGFNYPMESDGSYGDRVENPSMHDAASKGEKPMRGHATSHMMSMPMTYEVAMDWMDEMENADGSRGAHWTMAQTKEVQEKKGIRLDPVEFFAAMNMMYSDYCKIAKRYNVNTSDFYASMAKAFLEDKDAVPDKLMKYYECIVEH